MRANTALTSSKSEQFVIGFQVDLFLEFINSPFHAFGGARAKACSWLDIRNLRDVPLIYF